MVGLVRKKSHNLVSDEKFSEILRGSVWALGAKVLAALLGMVSYIIIARWYGAEVLGIVAVLQSFLMLATIFTVLGTNTSILRLIPEHLTKYSPSSAFMSLPQDPVPGPGNLPGDQGGGFLDPGRCQ